MRSVSAGLKAHCALGTTTLCHIWKITRRDGVIRRFTDLDVPVVMPADGTYSPNNSMAISAISASATIGAQAADAKIIFEDTAIAELDIVRSVYDGAEVEISFVNYADPTQGKGILLKGLFGPIEITNRLYGAVEFKGLLQRADQRIGESYSPECRADLGDARCTISLAGFTDTGVVSSVLSTVSLRVDLTGNPINGFYSLGVITFTSGANAGISMEVLNQTAFDATFDDVRIALGMPHPVLAGDAFSIVAGCDKRKVTCISKFNNINNFVGEPDVPGDTAMNDRPFVDISAPITGVRKPSPTGALPVR